jgi:cell division protein FtsL
MSKKKAWLYFSLIVVAAMFAGSVVSLMWDKWGALALKTADKLKGRTLPT